jgi:nanoRNase/pAp phosphatase (c-di-AMP/oligoRNAs hydrolase)
LSAEPGTDRREHRPLLIVISDSSTLPAGLRSRHRAIRVWSAEGVDSNSADTFGGDPAIGETYAWTREAPGVTALIDMDTPDRARSALSALRSVRPDAAVLLLSADMADVDGPGDGTLARAGELRDVLRIDLDDELQRLEAERRAHCLREFGAGDEVVPILIHDDPDPDAVSSAMAVVALLGGRPERTPIVTLDSITRPENRRMADLLHVRVTRVTLDELRRFDRVITVDTQPRDLQVDGRPRVAVIDHHPPEDNYDAEFVDIREEYGATASMMTEYLRSVDEKRIRESLATALLYGIRTDTDSLTRGVTPADVAAYAFLQGRADLQLVRRIQRPSYNPDLVRTYGRTLADLEYDDELCAAWLGALDAEHSHVMADLADFCLAIENVTWVVAAALLEDELVLTLRHAGRGAGAGAAARAIAARGGEGGGHATMARVVVPADRISTVLGIEAEGEAGSADVVLAVARLVREAIDEGDASRPASRPARQESVPAESNQ